MPYSPVIKVYYSRGSIQSSASEDPTNSFGPGLTDPSTCCSITTADGCNINTVTKFGLTNDHRLLPAPMISIQPEIYYANETPIGYTYNITLDGYATSVDLNQGIIPTGVNDSFNKTLGSIQKVKNIFSFNNGILTVLEASHDPVVKDKIILRASGCIIRNLNFEENENNWVNYSKYKVNLEANEINFVSCSGTGETFGCKDGQPPALPSGIINADSPNLLDMKKYKIKSFRDGWTINLTNNIYNSYIISGVNNQYHFNNDYIDIEYTVTANGKHYTNFKSDNEIYVTPAWEQAKNFCQNRVYKVVDRLIQDLLVVNNINEAQELFGSRSGNYDSIFYSPTGVVDSFNNNISATSGNSFGVYNEKITCETSESDGSFTATYKAIVKKKTLYQMIKYIQIQ